MAKCYFNIGLICDKKGQFLTASNSYRLCMDKCEDDENLKKSTIFKKAATNYAVTLEKLGKRDDALKQLKTLKQKFDDEIRVFNNLGILYKR